MKTMTRLARRWCGRRWTIPFSTNSSRSTRTWPRHPSQTGKRHPRFPVSCSCFHLFLLFSPSCPPLLLVQQLSGGDDRRVRERQKGPLCVILRHLSLPIDRYFIADAFLFTFFSPRAGLTKDHCESFFFSFLLFSSLFLSSLLLSSHFFPRSHAKNLTPSSFGSDP